MNSKIIMDLIENKACKRDLLENKIYNIVQIYKNIKTAAELSRHFFLEERDIPKKISIKENVKIFCYQCKKETKSVHGIYVSCCQKCGNKNYKNLMTNRQLCGVVAYVSGGRTKLGYQTALRLLRAGVTVIISTRYPEKAKENYLQEFDKDKWLDNLYIYETLDFNQKSTALQESFEKLRNFIEEKFGHLDILINLAAQTIRGIEKNSSEQKNRYGDSQFFPNEKKNSWTLKLGEVDAKEIEEVFRINAIAPFLLIQSMLSLLLKSKYERRMIINVHAKEGLFVKGKTGYHPHTNMAKAALHQLTYTINRTIFEEDQKIDCYGTDPGWISVDEYYKDSCPINFPPLTELDGACRILYPIFSKNKLKKCNYTLRHFDQIVI